MSLSRVVLTDLDQRPELTSAVRALFAAHPLGSEHLVCGVPAAMGLEPQSEDLRAGLGVLIAVERVAVVGALAICPYSDTQVTLWGPVSDRSDRLSGIARLLMDEARASVRAGGYESLRVLVDQRNRAARAQLLGLGLTAWKDAWCFERRPLQHGSDSDLAGVRIAARGDHDAVATILAEGFPDSDHCHPNLVQREQTGYRHYLLSDGGAVVAAAAVQPRSVRSWLKLIAVRRDARRRGFAKRLLAGICAAEARQRAPALGLEVLADNTAAIRAYEALRFIRLFTATVMTGPT